MTQTRHHLNSEPHLQGSTSTGDDTTPTLQTPSEEINEDSSTTTRPTYVRCFMQYENFAEAVKSTNKIISNVNTGNSFLDLTTKLGNNIRLSH